MVNAEPVSTSQVWIRGDVRAGRSDDQKVRIITQIVEQGSNAIGIERSEFWVYICDIPKMAEFGQVMPGPGNEAAWIASLPEDVRQRFSGN